MNSLPSSDFDDALFDPAHPFLGVVVCCTSIPPEQRSEIAKNATELGGTHKYDLTPDVTHLIVGEYDTPKYRHVAKERPDIKAMAAGWVEAVRDLWTQDAPIDFRALEKRWRLKAFETDGGDLLGAPAPALGAGAGAGAIAINNNHLRGRLLICLTGFDDAEERNDIMNTIHANGAAYTGDLTRKVTHLVVNRPEGRKYTAAKSWGTHTVSIEWVRESVERGMILDEVRYDPLLPKNERGVGAWKRLQDYRDRRTSLGKRAREASTAAGGAAGAAAAAQDDRKRKLRRTASAKLGNQRDGLWCDVLGNKPTSQRPSPAVGGVDDGTADDDSPSNAHGQEEGPGGLGLGLDLGQRQVMRQESSAGARPQTSSSVGPSAATSSLTQDTQPALSRPATTLGLPVQEPVFHSCYFFLVSSFSRRQTDVLASTILSMGGQMAPTLDDLSSAAAVAAFRRRILVVPQESQSVTHPRIFTTDDIGVVTEFYIEKCLHKKQFFDPTAHVIGRPFPVYPVRGFEQLAVCTSGFTGVDLNQVDKAVRQLGARYDERFTAQSSVLVATSLDAIRKQKLDLAIAWKVPVVSADWLWECIAAGFKVPFRPFMFPELNQSLTPPQTLEASAASGLQKGKDKGKEPMRRDSKSTTASSEELPVVQAEDSRRPTGKKSTGIRPFDTTAFDNECLDGGDDDDGNSPTQPTALPPPKIQQEDSVETAPFETAPTNQARTEQNSGATMATTASRNTSAPLSEVSSNALNKSPSPQKQDPPPPPHVASKKQQQQQQKQPALPPQPRRKGRRSLVRIHSEVADSAAEDEAADSREEDEEEHVAAAKNPDAEELRRKILDQQRLQRQQKAAADHAVLSSKLTSLLDAPASLGSDGNGKEHGSGSHAHAYAVASGSAAAAPPPRRRKRKIMGRAVSNVSAASTGSATDTVGGGANAAAAAAAAGGGGAGGAAAPMVAGLVRSLSHHLDGGEEEETEADAEARRRPPPATQLEYEDPNAKKYKALLMAGAEGVAGVAVEGAGDDDDDGRAGKLTFRDLQEGAAGTGAGAGGFGVGRRTRRR